MTQTRLKQLREDAVLTVHELAKTSGVSDDTISKIENGQRVARPSTLRKLASALGVSPQELRRPAKVEELALAGKAEAPGEAGPAQTTATPEENTAGDFRQVIERVMEAAREEAIRTEQAVNRVFASGGQPQPTFDNALIDAGRRIEREHASADVVEALCELALEHARGERVDERLEKENSRLRADLREREQAYQELMEARNS